MGSIHYRADDDEVRDFVNNGLNFADDFNIEHKQLPLNKAMR
jgi:hypothetical protein